MSEKGSTGLPVIGLAHEPYEDPLDLMAEIERLKAEQDATILAHFYVDGEIQDIADFTGDSLKLARDATRVPTSTIVFAGVHFMAESTKIMNPEKRVLIPDLLAGCSLAESCPAEKLDAFQEKLRSQGRSFVTVAYINTSAAVKSLCDWIVTSGNAREVIEDRVPTDQEILFVPDQHLGRYLSEVTGREMILWPGSCMVHEIFSLQDLFAPESVIREVWSSPTRNAHRTSSKTPTSSEGPRRCGSSACHGRNARRFWSRRMPR